MADLRTAPEVKEILADVADVDYMPASAADLRRLVHDYDVFWGGFDTKVDAETIARGVRLKAIVTATTGTDHIDKQAAAARGIAVMSNAADFEILEKFTATAEMALTLLLMCLRKLRTATRLALEGKYPGKVIGTQMSEITLGVLGVGRLGRMACRFGLAMCPRVVACDTRDVAFPAGAERVDFDTLLRQADAITIHIHMTPENHHLFNAQTLAKLKRGAVLVNTSRGDILDEEAVLAALASGQLGALGADVLHDEWRPDMADHPLIRYAREHENVVLTPHVGGSTFFSVREARLWTARKLVRFLEDLASKPTIAGD